MKMHLMKMHTSAVHALILLLLAGSAASAVNTTTVTFQNGIGGYSGTSDRRMSSNGTNVDGSTIDTDVSTNFIDGDPRHDYVIRFDDILASLPAGAVILDATLDIRTTSADVSADSGTNGAYNVYRLAQPFDNLSTFDGDFGGATGGVEPADGEADWILGSYDNTVAGMLERASVTRAVQSWLDGSPNYGFGVVSDRTGDGWSANTTGAATASNRPQLSVSYTTDPGVGISEFQEGRNGYSGTTDVFLSANPANPTTDGSTVDQGFLDGANAAGSSFDDPYLIKFDNLFDGNLSPGREIVKAELVFVSGFASSAADSPGPYTIHQLLTPFSTSSNYSDFAGDVVAMEAAGQIDSAAATLTGMDDTEVIAIDVTSILQNWSNGQPNHGFYIGTEGDAIEGRMGTSNGWQIFASGATDPNFRPFLRVVSIPEPAAMILLAIAALVGGCTRRVRHAG